MLFLYLNRNPGKIFKLCAQGFRARVSRNIAPEASKKNCSENGNFFEKVLTVKKNSTIWLNLMIEKNYISEIIDGKFSDARAKIINAGLKEFAKNSFGAVRTREIAALAGVNHAAISYYFGGKKELYKEIARQVVDFIEVYSTPYFERAKAIYKSKSRADAQILIRDYVMSRVCAESEKDGEILRCMIMIITREEMYQTEIFDIFYNGAFKPSGDMMLKLVEIASDGRYSGESAMVVSEMIMGQVHMFNSARAGFKRMNKWKTFGEREISVVRDKFSEMLGRIFA